jgi:hypothetical protein
MSRLARAARTRCMEMRLAAGVGPGVDHVRHKAVCLEDRSLAEDGHQDQHPCFAYWGRLHAQERKLVLGRKQE